MQPTPLTTALPKLAAMIDDERPLISAALLDVVVTDIGDAIVRAEVTTEHNFEILSMPSQHDYLNKALSRHWEKAAGFFLTLRIPAEAPMPQAPSPTPDGPKRTANTLTFTERAALQNWMNQDENTAYVAHESDALAAGKATGDLKMDITAGNILSMRKILGIDKIKPAKPAMAPVHDIDLVALQAIVQQHQMQLAPIVGLNIAEALVNLRDSLVGIEKLVMELRGPLEDLDQRLKSLEASND